jgi:hypothetical protein
MKWIDKNIVEHLQNGMVVNRKKEVVFFM